MPQPQTSEPRTRNPRGEGSRLRADIVAAATSLLEEGSAASVTLRAVARGAGISAPSIYRHFDSVDAILRAVVDEAFAELELLLRGQDPDAGEVDPLTHLVGVCRRYLDFAARRPQRYRLMFGGAWNAADVPPGNEAELAARADIGQNAFAVLVEALQRCIDAGTSASTDAVADAAALWVGLHGRAELRQTTSLFPWPADIDARLIGTLAHVQVSGEAARVLAGAAEAG
ncbi:TetR/AcrR family transcriptional regulator [Kineococcus sp. SYSU DK002]|uniref:TetR/AcrR family transcriptional regulator n=1 Tax=Kineococcus sp. SYSU DK002 TaxID=3383123 RepID=UPI003D7C85EF